ncbi:MATE family efflux transporter [Vannielia litorea]|uniref:MATE family efflux transporter n=1 Tax=Vannielia litorea TaxID=1217970 RepID=UPI001BD01CC9|nr:MATE family efflux transporter [Vannielia litorea]MBS8227196.1 hypothetical protein [Vannielia litorea]
MRAQAQPPAVPTTRSVFHLAWPLTLKSIMLHGIVVIDGWLVSSLGEGAVAVLGLSASIAGLLIGLIVAFSNATQIRIAQAFGSGDRAFLKSALLSGLTINLGVVTMGLALLALFAGPLIDGLAHNAEIASGARAYLSIFAVVILSEAVGHCLTGHFNGCGETRLPALSYMMAVPVNIAVSVVLIHGHLGAPDLGVTGAAIGSAIASVIQVGFLAGLLLYRNRTLLRVPGWRNGTYAASLRRHFTFSLPIAATFGSATIAMSVCGLLYARLPVNDFAAMTIIMPWVQVVGTFGMCWAQATGIHIGQMLGRSTAAEVLDRFLLSAWRTSFVASGLVAAIYTGICLASPWIYPELHPDTRATLLSFLPILIFLPFPKGSNAICGNTLRAGGETLYVMHIFVWSQWLFRVPVTAAAVLWLDASVTVVFALVLAEELIKFAPFHLRLRQGHWRSGRMED